MSDNPLASLALDASLRALAAALAVAVVLSLLRVRAAGVRHTAWTMVLAAMLLMPLLPSVVPELPVPLPSAPVMRVVDSLQPVPPPGTVWYSGPEQGVIATQARPDENGRVQRIEPAPRNWFPLVIVGIYIAGVLLLLGRLVHGWHAASMMVRRAKPVDPAMRTVESSEVVTPVTAGVFRPSVVLPATWRTWPSETLEAVLAHESEHVRRHDALVLLVARINRALFWFHPLAWWLERRLAVTAEHACDDAAARAVGEPRRYARILLEMADAVRANHS